MSFFGEGSTSAPGAGILTLAIRPRKGALKVLRDGHGWRALVKVTFAPTGGLASSVTRSLARC